MVRRCHKAHLASISRGCGRGHGCERSRQGASAPGIRAPGQATLPSPRCDRPPPERCGRRSGSGRTALSGLHDLSPPPPRTHACTLPRECSPAPPASTRKRGSLSFGRSSRPASSRVAGALAPGRFSHGRARTRRAPSSAERRRRAAVRTTRPPLLPGPRLCVFRQAQAVAGPFALSGVTKIPPRLTSNGPISLTMVCAGREIPAKSSLSMIYDMPRRDA